VEIFFHFSKTRHDIAIYTLNNNFVTTIRTHSPFSSQKDIADGGRNIAIIIIMKRKKRIIWKGNNGQNELFLLSIYLHSPLYCS
jgi:hypothetical protein